MALVNLAEFGLSGKISLADTVREIFKKWLIDDYLISNKINMITFMINSLRTAMINHLEEFIIIYPCKMLKVDQPDKNNVSEISDETVYNLKWMIREGGELSEIQVDVANMGYKINNNNLVRVLKFIHGEMAIEKRMLTLIEEV